MRAFTLRHHNGRLTEDALLMASLTVTANDEPHKDFFSPVRELSVSLHGDGNGKRSKMPMVWPQKMSKMPEGHMARITGWLLPVQAKITEILKGRNGMATFV